MAKMMSNGSMSEGEGRSRDLGVRVGVEKVIWVRVGGGVLCLHIASPS